MGKSLHRDSSIFALLVLFFSLSLPFQDIKADSPWIEEAKQQYQNENYEEVLILLSKIPEPANEPSIVRLKGLTFFHLQDYATARPLLEKSLNMNPKDRETGWALGTIYLDSNNSRKALEIVDRFIVENPDEYHMLLLKARIHVSLKEDDRAIDIFNSLMKMPAANKEQIALELASLYIKQGKISEAAEIMKKAVDSRSYSFESGELQYSLEYLRGAGVFIQKDSFLSVDVGYRLEKDDNIAVLKEYAEDYEIHKDIRHVFTANLEGMKLLGKSYGLTGEANLFLSRQKEFSEYDQLQQYYRLGTFWTNNKYGVNINYLFSHSDFNGNFYHRSHGATPGAYYRPTQNSLFYGFARYTANEYVNYFPSSYDHTLIQYTEKDYIESLLRAENPEFGDFARNEYVNYIPAAENRSGHEVAAGGIGQIWFLNRRGRLYFVYSNTHDFTFGRNWERVERLISAQLEYPVLNKLKGKLGYLEEKDSYIHLHTEYDIKRRDIVRRLNAALSYYPAERWEIKLEGNWTRRSSNIEYYSYTQRIVGIGLYWHFD